MMICEVCKQNDATIHITKVINGAKYEINVCEKCAKERTDLNFSEEVFPSTFTFQNILSGIMDYIGNSDQPQKVIDTSCDNCGTTYSEFKQKGLVGCSKCYESFKSTLEPVIKRVQGSKEHLGKIPKKAGKVIIEKRRLVELKENLQNAISSEEYEKAAEIRDIIRKLQNEQG
jgi:protein arginine kinase activator